MLKAFAKDTKEALNNYVYALVHPNTKKIFYIGRGIGNRGLGHLLKKDEKNQEKQKIIDSIRSKNNREPILDIIRYGLSKEMAIEIEAALIDSIGIEKLTNSKRGDSTIRGRTEASVLNLKFGGKQLNIDDIKDNVILFFCHNAMKEPNANIYDSTRQFWPLSEKKIMKRVNDGYFYKYAFGMSGNSILEVYEIINWFPAGTTVSSRVHIPNRNKQKYWEFIGSYVKNEKIRKLYRHHLLYQFGEPFKAKQSGFQYINSNSQS